jgi:hypothetical protein
MLSAGVNPSNLPLAVFAASPRPPTIDGFWQHAGVEPIMIRLDAGTALTLRTSTAHALFLADARLHVARSAEGLVELVRELPDHRLRELPGWPWLARSLEPRHVVASPWHWYDFADAVDNLSYGVDLWQPSRLVAVFELSYELATALGLDELAQDMEPGSALYEIYGLIRELNSAGPARWSARRKVAQYDLVTIFDAWSDIADILAEHMEWHG